MQAEIIAVGSELLTPSRIDTNSLFLTRKLNQHGIEVIRKTIIGDDRERLAHEIRRARAGAGIVIMTGGIGPTLDDISREAASDALGRDLRFDAEIMKQIEARILRVRREMAPINRRQAYILDGAEVLPNARGTAPGQWYEDDQGILMLLPGPPREIEPLFEEQCEPRLAKIGSRHHYYTACLRVAGLPESEVDQRVAPIYSAEQRVATTILASPGDIQLHMRAQAESLAEAREIAEALSRKVEAELGSAVFSRRNESLQAVVLGLLEERGLSLAVAESCTGGMMAEKLTSVPGSSKAFLGGFVTYSEQAKIDWLGVQAETIRAHGVVSEPVAREMAEGARRRAGASIGIATTGVAGPGGGTETTPTGTVFVAVADGSGVETGSLRIGGERDRVRLWATQSALNRLRRRLL